MLISDVSNHNLFYFDLVVEMLFCMISNLNSKTDYFYIKVKINYSNGLI